LLAVSPQRYSYECETYGEDDIEAFYVMAVSGHSKNVWSLEIRMLAMQCYPYDLSPTQY
jgi:hypothetical protein